jgi:regulator of RNase E activity RraB
MSKPATPLRTLLHIAPQADQPLLSKGQKTFNALIQKIEASRKELVDWQIATEAYHQKVTTEYLPLREAFANGQKDLLYGLDQALDRHKLTRPEQRVVKALICDLAQELIMVFDDDSLKPIYNKHSDTDFDEDETAAVGSFKAVAEDMLGVNLDVDDASAVSMQDVMAQIQAQMEAMQAQDFEAAQQRAQARSERPKTQKQLEREAKAKLESERTSQSIREVYRKLVSSLHPDREPDATERARKTALMQRVNQAYDKRDLLKLLELQLELEHIDASTIAGLSEDRLKHFNKVLKEQLAELEQEIEQVELPLREQFRVSPYALLYPHNILPLMQRDIVAMKQNVKHLKAELLVMLNLTAFKAWIAARKREAKAARF